ncbi:MAG: GNAT family N-acetyltransferase [Oscillospiraceae bacterium]|nr:GNAT family N-acetyltransferase [Oscillospiraceae bacterium]
MCKPELIRLEQSEGEVFETVVDWNYRWWGIPRGESREQVRYFMAHSVCTERLPQTFVVMSGKSPVGMYQLSMTDDLYGRPDLYPWLINVYVPEEHRGKNLCRFMMERVAETAQKAGLKRLYLYTNHVGLYEKFGWEFIEEVPTFHEESPLERLYQLEV